MAWQTTLTLMVRHLISDLNDCIDDRMYTEDRVRQAIVIAGIYVEQEFTGLDNAYVFDVEIPSIAPDPVTQSDTEAMALFSLKAACILDINKYQDTVTDGTGGLMVKDGDTQVDNREGFKGFKDIIELGPCKSYDKLLKQLSARESMNKGRGITGPFTHADFSQSGLSFGGGVARFFDSFASDRNR